MQKPNMSTPTYNTIYHQHIETATHKHFDHQKLLYIAKEQIKTLDLEQ